MKKHKTEDRGEKGCSVGDIRTKQRLKERQKIRRAVAGRKRAIKPRGWKNGMEEQMTEEEILDYVNLLEPTYFQTGERFVS